MIMDEMDDKGKLYGVRRTFVQLILVLILVSSLLPLMLLTVSTCYNNHYYYKEKILNISAPFSNPSLTQVQSGDIEHWILNATSIARLLAKKL